MLCWLNADNTFKSYYYLLAIIILFCQVFRQFFEMNNLHMVKNASTKIDYLRGQSILPFKFPPTKDDSRYIVVILVFVQNKLKTKEEITNMRNALTKTYADQHNVGTALVPASWRELAPYAGSFVIVDKEEDHDEDR